MRFNKFLNEVEDIVDTGKKGKEFETKLIKALEMVGLDFEVNHYAGKMWDILPKGDGWLRLVSDKEVNIKVAGTKWMFASTELYKMLPWEKLPDNWDVDKATKKVRNFLNKKGIAQTVYLKPKDKAIQMAIIDAVDKKDKEKLDTLMVKKNFYIEKLGQGYGVRILTNGERVTSIAIDKDGKVFMRSEKPRKMKGSTVVTFRTPTAKLGKIERKLKS